MRQPVGDTQCMLLGKSAVVEYQDEMTLAWPDSQYGMTPASWEIPNVARPERIGRRAVGAQNGGAATARHDVTQFGSIRVPMEFSQRTGLQAHRGAGDALANRELPDRCAPYETARVSARRLLSQAVAERQQSWVTHFRPPGRSPPQVAVRFGEPRLTIV